MKTNSNNAELASPPLQPPLPLSSEVSADDDETEASVLPERARIIGA